MTIRCQFSMYVRKQRWHFQNTETENWFFVSHLFVNANYSGYIKIFQLLHPLIFVSFEVSFEASFEASFSSRSKGRSLRSIRWFKNLKKVFSLVGNVIVQNTINIAHASNCFGNNFYWASSVKLYQLNFESDSTIAGNTWVSVFNQEFRFHWRKCWNFANSLKLYDS